MLDDGVHDAQRLKELQALPLDRRIIMPRYIDAEDLVKRMEPQDMLDANDIAEFPTADVVPVVRCKDCWHHNNCGIEQAALAPIGFFCALGERKDDAK